LNVRADEFDPLAYIESAFLDTEKKTPEDLPNPEIDQAFPTLTDYVRGSESNGRVGTTLKETHDGEVQPKGKRFRKTTMSAPRPRRATRSAERKIDPELQETWEALPKSIEFLTSFFDDSVTANYYSGEFKESRKELIQRLLDPQLTLEETSRLLGVCPATVRRYTNRRWLEHQRTKGGQRRFRLSDIVRFVDAHGRFPEE